MSETTTEATATEATGTTETAQEQPKPTETVDFWKQKAREQEKRAKENAEAAKRLAEIEESQKTEAEKGAERVRQAEERAQALEFRANVADIAAEAGVPAALLAGPEDRTVDSVKDYAKALNEWASGVKQKNNVSPREGTNPKAGANSVRDFARGLFGDD
jgi:ribonuclease D